jgi:hypothetical protein
MCPLTLSFDRSRAFSDSGGRNMASNAKSFLTEQLTIRNEALQDAGRIGLGTAQGEPLNSARQSISPKQREKRYAHLERFSVAAVHHAIRASRQLDQISAMAGMIARDKGSSKERKALLEGLENLARSYASEARMDMEHMAIAQLKHTPGWKRFKRQIV